MEAELAPCPHCKAVSRVEPNAAVRWRCAVCGGPLVPTDAGIARSNAELPDLVRAHRARAIALGWTVAAFALGSVAVMGAVMALLVGLASHFAGFVVAVFALVAGVNAAFYARNARRRRAEAQKALDQAWELVAGEVLRARPGDTTAADLARAMHTDERHAESLLAHLSAEGRARVDVRDDAELAYHGAAPEEAPEDAEADASRMRVR